MRKKKKGKSICIRGVGGYSGGEEISSYKFTWRWPRNKDEREEIGCHSYIKRKGIRKKEVMSRVWFLFVFISSVLHVGWGG